MASPRLQELSPAGHQEDNVRAEQARRAALRGSVQGVHDEPQQALPRSFS